tara:strand:+ start:5664 stop:6755 length:1092 start_codon:yes stop_codon:yes gene_type:complete
LKHVIIYKEKNRYAGWPANYGIWSWGDEIVTGFSLGFIDQNAKGLHPRDKNRPFQSLQVRSIDGGVTWNNQLAPLVIPGNIGSISSEEHMSFSYGMVSERINCPVTHKGGIDFTNPDFAMLCARSGLESGAESWFYISYNRCKSWEGPFILPMFGQKGVAARTDYLTYPNIDSNKLTLFLTSTKSNGKEGRVFCAETSDSGESFKFVSWLNAMPKGFEIMPSSLLLNSGVIITAVRSRNSFGNKNSIDLYRSEDYGKEWIYLSTPVKNTGKGGNPPALIQLIDGSLCLIYGFRDAPYGIRFITSQDDGYSWTKEKVLRDDGGDSDIGYPRATQRSDGKVVVVYYYNDSFQPERYIAATIFDPK